MIMSIRPNSATGTPKHTHTHTLHTRSNPAKNEPAIYSRAESEPRNICTISANELPPNGRGQILLARSPVVVVAWTPHRFGLARHFMCVCVISPVCARLAGSSFSLLYIVVDARDGNRFSIYYETAQNERVEPAGLAGPALAFEFITL